MSEIKLLVEVTRDQQIEIEDLCTREGLSISKYFMGLHEGHKRKEEQKKAVLSEEEKLDNFCDQVTNIVENSGSVDNEEEQPQPKKGKKKKQD